MEKANERQNTLSDGDTCVCVCTSVCVCVFKIGERMTLLTCITNSALTLRDVKHVQCELGLRADRLIKA